MSTEEAAEKLKCRCKAPHLWPQCASRATQEDMFCDVCREFTQAMKGPPDDRKTKDTYLGVHYAWHRYRPSWLSGGASFVGGNYAPYEPS